MTRPDSKTRSLEAYTVLRRDIIGGALAAGSKLRIGELQERYGIGALPIREALNRLSAEMLVSKLENRGFAVPPLDYEAYLEIANSRLVVETAALQLSIARREAAWEDRLVLAFHRLSKAGSSSGADDGTGAYLLSEAWAESHRQFHFELISACGNGWLTAFCHQLYEQSARYRSRRRRISSSSWAIRTNLVAEHREIMDAAIAGDAPTATRLLVEHYRRSVEIVLGNRVEVVRDPWRFVPSREVESAGDDHPAVASV